MNNAVNAIIAAALWTSIPLGYMPSTLINVRTLIHSQLLPAGRQRPAVTVNNPRIVDVIVSDSERVLLYGRKP